MTEIKFRAYNKFAQEMIPFSRLGMGVFNNADYFLLQFIGLQDVAGKDIYEGDIVELAPKKYMCVVEYSVRDARFILKNKNGYHGEFAIIPSAIKVIGNIYENPDLLQ